MAKANLTLVHNIEKISRERNIIGVIHRSSQRSEDRTKNLTRRYSETDNAFIGLTKFMLKYGYVGDVCEVYHAVTHLQIGTIKMTSKGKLVTKKIYDEK